MQYRLEKQRLNDRPHTLARFDLAVSLKTLKYYNPPTKHPPISENFPKFLAESAASSVLQQCYREGFRVYGLGFRVGSRLMVQGGGL